MIAFILGFLTIIIICILVSYFNKQLKAVVKRPSLFDFKFFFSVILIAVGVVAALAIGQDPAKKYKNLLEEKENLEYCLTTKPTYATIESAKSFNKKVEYGNSYFYRFNIQDRSIDIIDIDQCLLKERKNNHD